MIRAAPETFTFDTAHALIHDSQVDTTGQYLATCSSDETIKIFALSEDGTEEIRQTACLTGHKSPVLTISWAHSKFGRLLAAGTFSGQISSGARYSPGSGAGFTKTVPTPR
mmetsp:Transcript_20204/g.44934  ORF Transcript_20204/g.44934 Transcript_20204/m.44934 type:complete len:111 (+) Transcript_20204:10-342(+)